MAKFCSIIFVLLLMLASLSAHAQEYQRGDVNQDGAVNISDVTALIDRLLAGVPEGDVNQDGVANISDVTSLIDYLLSGSWPDDPVTPPDPHGWVDLGLPSATLWATHNIGASSPEDYGAYFAWGETTTKSYYDWSTYKWCNGSDVTMTKYCSMSEYGIVDNKTELDPEDDAAYVNWGPSWRMPTIEQVSELSNYCTIRWTPSNGLNGLLFTGRNGNTMFLPAAGGMEYGSLITAGSWGYYWTRTLYTEGPNHACTQTLGWIGMGSSQGRRFLGFPVRPVRASQN